MCGATLKVERDSAAQFDKLRYIPERRRFDGDGGSRLSSGRQQLYILARSSDQRLGFQRWTSGGILLIHMPT